MTTLSMLLAAFVLLLAFGVALWAWWAMQRSENQLRIAAGLEDVDLDIGAWPPASRINAPRASLG